MSGFHLCLVSYIFLCGVLLAHADHNLLALELSREYKMYDWVRALLDPTDIVQSPSSAKKHITPPPKFEFPEEDSTPSQRSRSRRSVSPSKKSSTSPRKSRQNRPVKDVLSTPSTTAANNSLQEALATTVSLETDEPNGVIETVEQIEVKTSGSPEKKTRGRKSKKAVAEAEAEAEIEEEVKEKEVKKEEKKSEKKKKKDTKEKEAEQQDVTSADPTDKDVTTAQTTVSLDVPISLPEVPSAAETQEMIAKAQEMVEDAIKNQATDGLSLVTGTKKRKPTDEDDEETAAEAAQRTKKAKVLEEKLKRERVRNRALFGVSAAFALA